MRDRELVRRSFAHRGAEFKTGADRRFTAPCRRSPRTFARHAGRVGRVRAITQPARWKIWGAPASGVLAMAFRPRELSEPSKFRGRALVRVRRRKVRFGR